MSQLKCNGLMWRERINNNNSMQLLPVNVRDTTASSNLGLVLIREEAGTQATN